MKAFKVNRIMTSIRRRGDQESEPPAETPVGVDEGPEAIATRSVKQFCESINNGGQGDEVLFLPPIVDAAESSPAAAAVCAKMLRHYLSRDYANRPSCQYNSLMLVRILVDNPGQTFTRNLDRKFADAGKELLKTTKNDSVRSMLMETLDYFEREKGWDEGLQPSVEMWKKEREKAFKAYGHKVPPQLPTRPLLQGFMPPQAAGAGPQSSRSHRSSSRRLPHPAELASRLEEGRTSAKLLSQFVANTQGTEIASDELVKEFADRCQNALRNVQMYMKAEDPAPDNDTMESLIDASEQLQTALNQHQRALLSARKQMGERQDTPTPPTAQGALAPVPAPASVPQAPSPMSPEMPGLSGYGTQPQWNETAGSPYAQASGANPTAGASSSSGYDGLGSGYSKGKQVYISPTAGASSSSAAREAEPPSPESPAEDPFRDPQDDPYTSSSASRWESRYNTGAGSSSAGRFNHNPLSQHPISPRGSPSLSGVEPPPGPPPGRAAYDDDEEDLYDSTPKKKASVARP